MAFRKKIRIYFDQGDPAHIAFHGQHTILAQRVMEEYIESLGISWGEWYGSKERFFPVAKFTIEFKKPLFPGRHYFVDVQFTHLGRTSLKVEYKILSLKEELCCSIETVYVCVEGRDFRPKPFPKRWRPLLEKAVSDS